MPKLELTHEVRLGAIKAAVWKNDTENGVRFNVTLTLELPEPKPGSQTCRLLVLFKDDARAILLAVLGIPIGNRAS